MHTFSMNTLRMAMYVCRACGYECAYANRFRKRPVCGIAWD